ncbi:MAG: hydantoinase/oxoprolinase family protein [Alphaproteobacteria bacterium]|nr:hydantoinase/oxoprolinase family protein [Alphaproteobacteria bacterium]
MRIGIDVGGTNTDAALMDGLAVLAAYKTPTTADVSSGIVRALEEVLKQSGVAAGAIEAVMIGTTHFTNAFVERRRLLPVGVLRLALPAAIGLPPFTDWPGDLKAAVEGRSHMVGGGVEYDGAPLAPLDEAAVRRAAQDMRKAGLRTVAISAIFSPVNADMEVRAGEIVREELPDAALSLSHEIGRVGLLERENAAIMNASLADLATRVVSSFRQALERLHIAAPFYISQNDGTLMSAAFVERYPVLTFASGPTNSMRGAAFLARAKNAMVVDIGGTTSDIGMLLNGFPRESAVAVSIGGVRTNFRMPDVLAIGLGGGSRVRQDGGQVSVGPDSVGYELTSEALVFGGRTPTATDIAVAAGQATVGDASRVAGLDRGLVTAAVETIHDMLDVAVDRMKTAAGDLPLVLVGGGTILVSRQIKGTSTMVIPEHAGVANAIGAAIAQVGGEVDRVYTYETVGREKALAEARQEATAKAVAAGADPATVGIVDVEEVPLAYMPGGSCRVRIKAVGDLKHGSGRVR